MNATAAPVRRKLNPPQPAASPFPYHPGSLLSVNDLSLDALNHILEPRHRSREPGSADARPHPGQAAGGAAVLRVVHAHADQLRTGGQEPGRRHRADFEPVVEHRKGRVAEGHRAHAARAGRGGHHPAAQLLGRAVAAGRGDASAGAQRGRRHARASHPGAARSAHHPGASAAGHRARRRGHAGRRRR